MTERLMLIGSPVAHSKSPAIHQIFGTQTGLTVQYEARAVEADAVESVVREFFATGGRGMNITVPHKEQVFTLVDRLTPEAQQARAVNTLWMESGTLVGHNTDGLGLLDDLDRLALPMTGQRLLVLGAGGAIAGCLGPLMARGPARVTLVNRTLARAQAIADRFPDIDVLPFEALSSFDAPIDGVISGLSSGLTGVWDVPLPTQCLSSTTWCYDLVYQATATPFVMACRPFTDRCYDGFGMLVGQAARAFSAWFDCPVDPWQAYRQLRPHGQPV
ncbi:MAG: shikimate dehydrogenase [Gammaproteobacteria bacterium]|nr:shikimate dehydrogenase [Gammaproteobacteria bacterium]